MPNNSTHKRVIIASDFHLKFAMKQSDQERQDRILSFFDSLMDNTEILILNGDIFDLWFSWNRVIIRGYFSVLCKLKQLNENGCRLIFVAGNHDFWFNRFLSDEIGMEIHSDSFSGTIQGKKILVTHGDVHTSNDIRYKFFRAFIRNRFVMGIFKLLHPDLSLKLGMLLSRSSRDRKIPEQLKRVKEQGLENFAKKQITRFDIVTMGHSHNPKIIEFDNGIYANSGDWINHNSYLELQNGKLELKYFLKKSIIKSTTL